MKPTYINQTEISAFGRRLLEDERSAATIEKYTREARRFAAFLGGRAVTKSAVAEWKEAITSSGCSPSTANVRLTALSRFLDFIGRGDCSVKRLRLQRRVFRDDSRSLTRKDYEQLTATAESLGRERLALLMETICSTGIRVSEVRYITVEAASAGRDIPQGQDTHNTTPRQTLPEAAEIRQKAKNRLRRGFSLQKRQKPVPKTDMGGHEIRVRAGRHLALQSLPSQSAASFRTLLL